MLSIYELTVNNGIDYREKCLEVEKTEPLKDSNVQFANQEPPKIILENGNEDPIVSLNEEDLANIKYSDSRSNLINNHYSRPFQQDGVQINIESLKIDNLNFSNDMSHQISSVRKEERDLMLLLKQNYPLLKVLDTYYVDKLEEKERKKKEKEERNMKNSPMLIKFIKKEL